MRVFGVGYRSGQPGQTVNLLAYAYGGSNPPPTTVKSEGGSKNFAGVAQLARASAFQAEGRGFESRLPLPDAGSSMRTVGGEAPVAQW